MHGPLRQLSTITALISVVAICGCTAFKTTKAYPGGAKNSEEVALVKSSVSAPITLVDVNWDPYIDFRVEGAQRYYVEGWKVRVPPGTHKIHFWYSEHRFGKGATKYAFVIFKARAGKTYIARGKNVDGFRLHWIEDADTQEVVGGTKP